LSHPGNSPVNSAADSLVTRRRVLAIAAVAMLTGMVLPIIEFNTGIPNI
jgi:hypothetical protein